MRNYTWLPDPIFTCTYVLTSYHNRNRAINARIDFWRRAAYAWAAKSFNTRALWKFRRLSSLIDVTNELSVFISITRTSTYEYYLYRPIHYRRFQFSQLSTNGETIFIVATGCVKRLRNTFCLNWNFSLREKFLRCGLLWIDNGTVFKIETASCANSNAAPTEFASRNYRREARFEFAVVGTLV